MKVELRSYTDYMQDYLSHPSQRQRNSSRGEEQKWEKLRRHLTKELSEFGRAGNSGDENIDFFVGSDWFADKCFHVVLLTWKLLDPIVLNAIGEFLIKNPSYTVTIAKAPPDPVYSFEIFISNDWALFRIFEKNAGQCARLIARHPVLSAFANKQGIQLGRST
jgi:hypothetical protein